MAAQRPIRPWADEEDRQTKLRRQVDELEAAGVDEP
jgi:hypothetical protein